MKKYPLLLALAMLWPAPLLAQAPGAKPALTANAALKYWQAFAQLPPLDKDQEKLLDEWARVPLDDAARKVIDSGKSSLLYLHRGGKLAACDWGLDHQDGIGLLLPHLQRARLLSRLAFLRARLEFQQGDAQAAVDDVADAMALGRQSAADPVLVSLLVDFAIEIQAVDLLAGQLPRLDAATRKRLRRHLEALPAARTVREAVLGEKEIFCKAWLVPALQAAEAKKKDGWQQLMRTRFDREKDFKDFMQALGTPSFEHVLEVAKAYEGCYDDMARLADLPPEELRARYPAFLEKANKSNAFAPLLLPALDTAAAAEARYLAHLAMLRAALVIVQDGPEKVKTLKDPYGDGPFAYKVLPQGFELKSKLVYRGEAVTLTVGQTKKE